MAVLQPDSKVLSPPSVDLAPSNQQSQILSLLIGLDDALRSAADPEEIVRVATRFLGEHLSADCCTYYEVEEDQDTSHLAGYHARESCKLAETFRLTQFGTDFAESMRANIPFILEDIENDLQADVAQAAYQDAGIRSVAAAPLHKAERLLAVMELHQFTPRQWGPEEINLLRLSAGRCWEALERSRAMRNLQISERRLRLTQRAGHLGSFEWLMQEDRILWTPELEALYEVAEGSFEGSLNDWIKRVIPADVEGVIAGVQSCVAQHKPEYDYEFRAILPDGSLRWLRGQSLFFYDENGAPERMLGININIDDRKRAEAHLERQWQAFDTALSNTPDHTYTFNLQGRFTYANRTLLTLFNRPLDEVLGKNVFDLEYPPELAERVDRQIQQVIDTKKPLRDHTPFSDQTGEIRHFEYIFSPILSDDGRVEGVAGSSRDMTERKQVEDALRRANRELEEFAYVASHDLQEPLRMVNIYTQRLLKAIPAGDANLEAYADFVRQGAKRMESLIFDLLNFSRTVHSNNELPVGDADLSAALAEAVSVLKSTIEETSAVVTSDPLPQVYGDTQQLAHVFQNLLSNSLKYCQPGVTPVIGIAARREGNNWIISVQDNGIGFDQQYADRIFGLFKRLHKGAYPGTGLGLAICQRIVERFGGRIWAESASGRGAVFHISLHAAKAS